MIDDSQQAVNGGVRLQLFKGSVMITGRSSSTDSLFDESVVTFEDDHGAYDQADAEGFIKLNALRLTGGRWRDRAERTITGRGL